VAAIVVDDRFNAEKVFDICRAKLEPNFVPSYLQVVDEIPKTASEKPQERFLLVEFSAGGDNIHAADGYGRLMLHSKFSTT
jgi:carnitine-CoA ligase